MSSAETPCSLTVRDLGRMPYAEAFALQKDLQRDVLAAREKDRREWIGYLLLVEHDPPVITVSRRKGARNHLIATPEMLERAGVGVAETDRGGDITYHGPGQLVAYPIVDLNRLGLRLHGYMRLLEETVIRTLAAWEIAGERDESATGVWVKMDADRSVTNPAKICAMGVRVSRWVTMHGLALNVRTDLSHFDLIVPCGLVGRPVTSMQQRLGERCPGMDEIKQKLASEFRAAATELMSR